MIARLWDRLTLYLPVALMAVLALISYWLVRTAPGDKQAEAVAVHDNNPDYYLHSFSAQSFDDNGKVYARFKGLWVGISRIPNGPKSMTFMAKLMAPVVP